MNQPRAAVMPPAMLWYAAAFAAALLGASLFATVSLRQAIFLATALAITIAAIVNSRLALYLIIFSMLLSPEIPIYNLGRRQLVIRLEDVLLALVWSAWFARTALTKQPGLVRVSPLNKPIAFYVGICLLATIWGFIQGTVSGPTGIFFVVKYLEFFVIYFVTLNYVTKLSQAKSMVGAIVITAVLVCFSALWQGSYGTRASAPFEGEAGEPNTLAGYLVIIISLVVAFLMAMPLERLSSLGRYKFNREIAVAIGLASVLVILLLFGHGGGSGRATAPFEGPGGEPNTLAGYLVVVISVVVAVIATVSQRNLRVLGIILLCVMGYTLLNTFSRSGWLAMLASLCTIFAIMRVRAHWWLAPLILVATLAFVPTRYGERAYKTFRAAPGQAGQTGDVNLDSSSAGRVERWRMVMRDSFEKPVLGYGVTGYGFVDGQYWRTLIETGFFGLGILLWLIVRIFKTQRWSLRNVQDPFSRGLAAGVISATAGLCVMAIFANVFIIVRIMEPFWLLVALVARLPELERSEAEAAVSAPGAEPASGMLSNAGAYSGNLGLLRG